MKIFSWMRNKHNGKNVANKPNIPEYMPHHCKEEYSDWPNGLLAIGTLGNSNLSHSDKLSNIQENQNHLKSTAALQEDYEEEVDHKELMLLLHKHISLDSTTTVEKFLDCLEGAKDTRVNNNNNNNEKNGNIGKKSFSFLLKKALLCRGGFVPTPIVRDPLPDVKLDKSRMEKILRALLHKKIYPQRPNQKSGSKKYLDMPEIDGDEEEYEEACRQSKWVKTDSEYIVLEI